MPKKKTGGKIYVLDTSVILHDHNAINSFEEHDVGIPITVLEELDDFKKGNNTKNFEAREFIRALDKLAGGHSLQDWIPLEGEGLGRFIIVMNNNGITVDAEKIFDQRKNDHKILNAAMSLQAKEKDKKVVLVTKDVNLRLKAKSLDIPAEDYETGKVKNGNWIYSGNEFVEGLESETIRSLFNKGFLEDTPFLQSPAVSNQFYVLKNGKSSALAYYNPETSWMERVDKQYTYGIKPKNAEQTFAMHAIMNPAVRLVTIQGVAGTGKTLLALAGALEQRKKFRQVILARPIVPLSNKDIGYLPGDAKEKINPYMEPLWDNLKYIQNQFGAQEKRHKQIDQMIQDEKIVITPLAYIRGRSLSDVMIIVDEAQNLTPHEVKTIITRAGENTKIIFTGDVNQIDTPYLDEQSNGLSFVIDKLKGNPLFAHIALIHGERSALANLANELL